MKKLLLVSLLFVSCNLWAQNGQTSRISVFTPNSKQPDAVSQRDSAANALHNCIKWNYFLLGRGVLMFSDEFSIGKGFTGEVGLGLTYRDFVFEAMKGSLDGGDPTTTYWSNETPVLHPCGAAALRYYLGGYDDFDGAFVEAGVSYRPYSFTNNTPGIPTSSSFTPSYYFFDEQFKFGYQIESNESDFSYETYIGIGIRNAIYSYYNETTDNFGNTIYTPTTVKATYPQFLFGAKVGYSF